MSQSAIPTISCFSPLAVPIEARFDGPQLTSDGGLVWLAEADGALGLCAALSTRLPEWRTGPVRHSLDLKDVCFAERLSDHTFWANQVRLLLHAAAYWLLDTIRRWLAALMSPGCSWTRCAFGCSRSAAGSSNTFTA